MKLPSILECRQFSLALNYQHMHYVRQPLGNPRHYSGVLNIDGNEHEIRLYVNTSHTIHQSAFNLTIGNEEKAQGLLPTKLHYHPSIFSNKASIQTADYEDGIFPITPDENCLARISSSNRHLTSGKIILPDNDTIKYKWKRSNKKYRLVVNGRSLLEIEEEIKSEVRHYSFILRKIDSLKNLSYYNELACILTMLFITKIGWQIDKSSPISGSWPKILRPGFYKKRW